MKHSLCLLMIVMLGACGVTDLSTAQIASASTTCVSDPVASSADDDAVAHCPPPSQVQIAQAAAASYALRYVDPAPTSRADGGCVTTANSTTCVLQLQFGGGQVILIRCTAQSNGDVDCTSDVIQGAARSLLQAAEALERD